MTAHQTIESKASAAADTSRAMTGAEIVVRGLVDQGVEVLFGYPGGAVLPIYDALFHEPRLQHILVRHEQGATHAAEGYARSSGKPGVVLVTSGPGATNAITGIMDALMDSIPMVVITGQVPTHLIGTDAFQEADTVGMTRSCTKHNYLVKDVRDLPQIIHEAFKIATTGRPGPVLIDIPKDVQFAKGEYYGPSEVRSTHAYAPRTKADASRIAEAVKLIAGARRPIFYTGGGVINAGPEASAKLREFQALTGAPVTSTLMGLGAFPAADPAWLGMLGMHGTFEANNAMHDCDVMICVGARFDDRVTGRLDAFSPGSKKIHIDIDPSSINKNVRVDLPIVGDAGSVLEDLIAAWKAGGREPNKAALTDWWAQIDQWRARECLKYRTSDTVIKPQYAIQRLYELTKGKDIYITTEVGQHQMWAAQFFRFEEPNRWMTSGGLGTMGYGLPAALGVQMAHPGVGHRHRRRSLDPDVHPGAVDRDPVRPAGQDLHPEQRVDGHGPPVAAAVARRALQPLLFRQSARLREAGRGLRRPRHPLLGSGRAGRQDPGDDQQRQAVIFDCRVEKHENCLPMIPSGKAHNEMIMGEVEDIGNVIGEAGAGLV
jgi:acetolactate synthase-1/2/3 large subunit